jgi:hypothetical protein
MVASDRRPNRVREVPIAIRIQLVNEYWQRGLDLKLGLAVADEWMDGNSVRVAGSKFHKVLLLASGTR